MRLFTAINLSEEVRMRLERLISSLRPEALLKWSPIDNLHVTTKFIGEWPEQRLEELSDALAGLPSRPPFPVAVRGFGWFPNERSPRVLWCGIDGGDPLQTLARDVEAVLLPLGIAREERKYTPHLTLARISHPVPLDRLRERVSELRESPVGTFRVTGVHLYHSQPGSNSSRYRKLQTYDFQPAAAVGRA